MSKLRRLVRALVRERARIGVYSHVDDPLARWYAAVDREQPLPDVDRFLRDMLPTFAALHNYLDACRRDRKVPDRGTSWER